MPNQALKALYEPELHYFFDTPDFPLEKALLITAQACAQWSRYYQAELLAPKSRRSTRARSGELPHDLEAKRKYIEDILTWIQDSSHGTDLFQLFLNSEPIEESDRSQILFSHHDDTCCWFLYLTPEQFAAVQKEWRASGLPDDLFYDSQRKRCIRAESETKIAHFFRWLGFEVESNRCYTPQQWVHRNDQQPDQHENHLPN